MIEVSLGFIIGVLMSAWIYSYKSDKYKEVIKLLERRIYGKSKKSKEESKERGKNI